MPLHVVASKYEALRQELPPESAQLARECHAFTRARVLESPADLLSLVFLYSSGDLSLREIAGVCTGRGKPLTEEAVRPRLTACPQWLERLVGKLLPAPALPARTAGPWQLVICEGSQISGPGAQGTDYRWPVAYDPVAQQIQALHVSDVHTGESLTRFTWRPGMVVLGDRNFAKAPALFATRASGAQVGVRMPPQYWRLWSTSGAPVDLVAALPAAGPQSRLSFALQLREEKREQRLPLWIHARPLNELQCHRARRRAQRQARRCGRTLRTHTLCLSEGVVVLTTGPPTELSAATSLAVSRMRWHVELVIKRDKSLLGAAKVRAQGGSPLAIVDLTGKLLVALLVERRAVARLGNEWTQRLTVRAATWWRLWKLLAKELQEAVLDPGRWAEWDWRAVVRALAERPRPRKLQIVPAAVARWLQASPLAPLRQAA